MLRVLKFKCLSLLYIKRDIDMNAKESSPKVHKTGRRRPGKRERMANLRNRVHPYPEPSTSSTAPVNTPIDDTNHQQLRENVNVREIHRTESRSVGTQDDRAAELLFDPLPGGMELSSLIDVVIANHHRAPAALLGIVLETPGATEVNAVERRRLYELIVSVVYACRRLAVTSAAAAQRAYVLSGDVILGLQEAASFLVQQANRPVPAGMTDAVEPPPFHGEVRQEEVVISDDDGFDDPYL